MVWSAFSVVYGEYWALVALTVGTAFVGIVLWATLAGSMLPIPLMRLGFDPAASSAPLCRDAGRCHRPRHLLQRRDRGPPRHPDL